jgi:arylsulfatase A-like enzyme
LIRDLKSRGLLDETLIVWMGEFGRSPKVQNTKQFGPDGRDHWPTCYTVLFAGGGTVPGAIYGASDKIGGYPASDPVSPDDIAATMFWALGIDPETIVYDTLNRPLPIAAGKPITRIFG